MPGSFFKHLSKASRYAAKFLYGILIVASLGGYEVNALVPPTNSSQPVLGAAEHNIIRSALSTQSTLNNLGFSLNESYDFSQQTQPAQALPDLQDSSALQNSAAAHAQSCVFDHISSPYGQNLFAGTGTSWTLEHAVNSWAYEARHYSYPASCVPGEQCGHYTQIIWHDSRDVGCVIQQCATMTNRSGNALFGGRSGVMIFCHYNPPGNIIARQPYPPLQNTPDIDLAVQAKVLLQGAYKANDNLMQAELPPPLTEPYSALGHSVSGVRQLNNNLLTISGDNAIVDWVLLELRAAATPTQILESKAVLLQRDGDLVDPSSGSNTLLFPERPAGNYHIAVRHRNHLGVMTRQAVGLAATAVILDFSALSTTVYGQAARAEYAGKALLWSGDVNHDGRIIAEGANNDVAQILQTVLLAAGNINYAANYIVTGNSNADLGLDGQVIFAGVNNDANFIRANVLLHPDNTQNNANFIIQQQLP